LSDDDALLLKVHMLLLDDVVEAGEVVTLQRVDGGPIQFGAPASKVPQTGQRTMSVVSHALVAGL
jgi:hypothetical protein